MTVTRLPATITGISLICFGAGVVPAAGLAFERQVQARTAIERVYHRHRIWPVENPGPKPSFESTISEATISAAVTDARAKEAALSKRWQRVIDADEIQAELDRIAAASRDPKMLAELFAALNDDPELIAQVLIRPLIVDRALRSLYSRDLVIHADVRARAERAAVEAGDASLLQETDDAFVVAADARATWPKQGFDSWWRDQRVRYSQVVVPATTDAVFTLPQLPSTNCPPDSWAQMSTFVPSHRTQHTAVWTGNEMIVWGGKDENYGAVNTGGRYVPATDSWLPMKSNDSTSRYGHTAVWTGQEMLVFGGGGLPDIQRYDPASDSWTVRSSLNAPSGRSDHSAVWTGTQMIVWGGGPDSSSPVSTGGRYMPATDTWAPTQLAGAPDERRSHVAVWTGSRMIVWGGLGIGGAVDTGGQYDPVSDTWMATSTENAPGPRLKPAFAWTGSLLLVWGGGNVGGNGYATGGRYDPVTDLWTPMASGSPPGRKLVTGIWTGSQFVVWGGEDNSAAKGDGGRYSPATDSWTPISSVGAPWARWGHTAVWTGSRMVVWGGGSTANLVGPFFTSGGRYDPVSDSWMPTAVNAPAPMPRTRGIAIWTGAEMVVWGGTTEAQQDSVSLATGGRYVPSLDAWTPTTTIGAPPPESRPVAVWSGDRVLVWGATGGAGYRPADDTWGPISTLNAPAGAGTAVWSGSEMIVWGGNGLAAGGRYRPASDSWFPVSVTGAPSPRTGMSAVWGGGRMIVWGGISTTSPFPPTCTGKRYDPGTDTWGSMASLTEACAGHTAVWSGSEMLTYGGIRASQILSTQGGRYNPASNSWSLMTATGSPGSRDGHTAVWTSAGMVVWGGGVFGDDGRVYSPASNTWMTMFTGPNRPSRRRSPLSVWTGAEALIWGGDAAPGTGGRYCVCTTSATEICNGVDDNCNGIVDTDAAVPTPGTIAGVTFASASGELNLMWPTAPDASSYDVVRGDLMVLRASGGNFATATETCLADGINAPLVENTSPAADAGFWYLVRGNNCVGGGTYGDSTRDSGILASGQGCP